MGPPPVSIPEACDTLDLGCGFAKHPGAFGVDLDPEAKPDLIHDLECTPFPLPSSRFETVICQDVIEHVADVRKFLTEVHRVARPGGTVWIRTPHFSSWYAYNDPTHKHVFGYFAFDRFTTSGEPKRSVPLFRYRRRRFVFPRLHRLDGVAWLANRAPSRYEQLFAFAFPAENLEMELEVAK